MPKGKVHPVLPTEDTLCPWSVLSVPLSPLNRQKGIICVLKELLGTWEHKHF